MTLERWLLLIGLTAAALDVGLLWWLTRRPRPRRGGYVHRR